MLELVAMNEDIALYVGDIDTCFRHEANNRPKALYEARKYIAELVKARTAEPMIDFLRRNPCGLVSARELSGDVKSDAFGLYFSATAGTQTSNIKVKGAIETLADRRGIHYIENSFEHEDFRLPISKGENGEFKVLSDDNGRIAMDFYNDSPIYQYYASLLADRSLFPAGKRVYRISLADIESRRLALDHMLTLAAIANWIPGSEKAVDKYFLVEPEPAGAFKTKPVGTPNVPFVAITPAFDTSELFPWTELVMGPEDSIAIRAAVRGASSEASDNLLFHQDYPESAFCPESDAPAVTRTYAAGLLSLAMTTWESSGEYQRYLTFSLDSGFGHTVGEDRIYIDAMFDAIESNAMHICEWRNCSNVFLELRRGRKHNCSQSCANQASKENVSMRER